MSTEQVARAQDAKISALIADIMVTASGRSSMDMQDAVDDLHEAIADIRGEFAALLDALERMRDVASAVLRGVPVRDFDEAFAESAALLRKHGRLT